jgi:hypothetical protein
MKDGINSQANKVIGNATLYDPPEIPLHHRINTTASIIVRPYLHI